MPHPRFTLLGEMAAIEAGLKMLPKLPKYDPFHPDTGALQDKLKELQEHLEVLILTVAETRTTCSHLHARLIDENDQD